MGPNYLKHVLLIKCPPLDHRQVLLYQKFGPNS